MHGCGNAQFHSNVVLFLQNVCFCTGITSPLTIFTYLLQKQNNSNRPSSPYVRDTTAGSSVRVRVCACRRRSLETQYNITGVSRAVQSVCVGISWKPRRAMATHVCSYELKTRPSSHSPRYCNSRIHFHIHYNNQTHIMVDLMAHRKACAVFPIFIFRMRHISRYPHSKGGPCIIVLQCPNFGTMFL